MGQTSLQFCTFLSHQFLLLLQKLIDLKSENRWLTCGNSIILKSSIFSFQGDTSRLWISLCLDLCVFFARVQRQILWARCCWRRASTALSATMTRFTSSSRREARSRSPTRARPRCPGLPESARSERATGPNTINHNHINGFTGFGELADLECLQGQREERDEWGRRKVAKMVGLFNAWEWSANGFKETFCSRFLSLGCCSLTVISVLNEPAVGCL